MLAERAAKRMSVARPFTIGNRASTPKATLDWNASPVQRPRNLRTRHPRSNDVLLRCGVRILTGASDGSPTNWQRPMLGSGSLRPIRCAGFYKWTSEAESKPAVEPVVRTAEEPGQTVNVDLCFVPATHTAEVKLPAVSGSSGRLVVERPKEAAPSYPGQVFAQSDLEYAEAMHQFRTASAEPTPDTSSAGSEPDGATTVREQKRALHQAESELRAQRRQVREQCKQQDAAWRALRERRRAQPLIVKLARNPSWCIIEVISRRGDPYGRKTTPQAV